MNIKFFISAFALFATFNLANAALADIQESNSWIYLYNSNGHRYKTLSASTVGNLVGFCESYFISKNGSWYYFFDDRGNRFLTKSVSEIGEIQSITNNSFVSKKDSWIYTWDKKGNRTGTRPAK